MLVGRCRLDPPDFVRVVLLIQVLTLVLQNVKTMRRDPIRRFQNAPTRLKIYLSRRTATDKVCSCTLEVVLNG